MPGWPREVVLKRLLAVAALLAACGGPPAPTPAPLAPKVAEPAPPLPAAPVQLRIHPTALRATLGPLAPAPLDALIDSLGALGVDAAAPVHATLRGSPPTAVRRVEEDLGRIIQSPPVGGLDVWFETHPLPPAWLHLRLVGRAAAARGANPEATLGEHLGALQRIRLNEPAPGVAAALETSVDALPALAPLGDVTLYRLLSAELPTLVLVDTRSPWRVVDVIVDLDLGADAFVAALGALPELSGGAPHPALPGAAPVQARLALADSLTLLDTADRVERILPVLSDDARLLPAEAWALLGPTLTARLTARRLGAALFDDLHLTLGAANTGLRLTVRSQLSAKGAPLGALRDGVAPLPHATTAARGAFALTWAVGPWQAPLAGLPQPEWAFPAALQQLNRCGPTCWTAAWTALPLYFGRQLAHTLASLGAPALANLPLDRLRGASAAASAALEPTLVALQTTGPAAAPPLTQRTTPTGTWLVLGDPPAPLAPTPAGPVLQLSGRPTDGPFSRFDARFEYADGHQVLTVEATPRQAQAAP